MSRFFSSFCTDRHCHTHRLARTVAADNSTVFCCALRAQQVHSGTNRDCSMKCDCDAVYRSLRKVGTEKLARRSWDVTRSPSTRRLTGTCRDSVDT